jgi:hypothetical protein
MTINYVSSDTILPIAKMGYLLAKGDYEGYYVEIMSNSPYDRIPSVVIAIFKDNEEIYQGIAKGFTDSGIEAAKQQIDLFIQQEIREDFKSLS